MTPMTTPNWPQCFRRQRIRRASGLRRPWPMRDITRGAICMHAHQKVVMPEAQSPLEHPYHKDRFNYDEETDSYICPLGRRLPFTRMKRTRGISVLYRASGAVCRGCPAFGVCTRDGRHGRALEIGPHDTTLRRHRAWMRTDRARGAYARRKGLVEPVFGIIKERQAARRFLLRGLVNVALSGPCWPQPSTCAPYGKHGIARQPHVASRANSPILSPQ